VVELLLKHGANANARCKVRAFVALYTVYILEAPLLSCVRAALFVMTCAPPCRRE